MKKVVVLVLSFGLIGSAMGQIVYPTNVFWQFLEGLQAGDSTTQNYLQYKNGFLLLETDQRDEKMLQLRNEINDIGIVTLFIDASGNGGISADSSNGGTVVKLRGALSDHSYINNEFVSVGRGGQSQDYGGTIDGAQFTVSDGSRNPYDSLGNADYWQMMVQSSSDVLGEGAGVAFTNESAAGDINVGGGVLYKKLGNNGHGALEFYAKDGTTNFAAPNKYMRLGGDTVNILNKLNIPTTTSGGDGVIYQNGTRLLSTQRVVNDGLSSVFLGYGAGNLTTSNTSNVGIGGDALNDLTSGGSNTAVGSQAGDNITTGGTNTLLGFGAGSSITTGTSNTFLGAASGSNNTGNSNIFIGSDSGNSTPFFTVSNKLVVENSDSNEPLLHGDFLADTLKINGGLRVRDTVELQTVPTGTSDTVLILDGDVVKQKDISSFADNIYNTDGTLTGDRTLDLDTYDLTFNGGNVGIGTNAPSALLNVQNSSNGVLLARFKDNINAATYLDIKADPTLTDYTALYFGSDRKIMSKQGGPLFLSCNVNFVDGLSTKMAITPTEVQIGTITGARLAVKGNGSTSATTSFLVQNSSNTSLLTIRDNGNVGIGTTTPAAKIHADNTATTGVGAIIENSDVTNTDDIIQFHNSTGEVASITNDGGAGFGNSSIDASAKVEITSTTKGFLPPRMTGTQAEAISSPAEGLMVYSTDGSGVTITSKGWWGYDGSTWVKLN